MTRLLVVCGLLAPVLRLGLIVLLGFLHPTYSQTADFISELGAPDAPHARLMNYVGITLVGVLLAAFSIALWRSSTGRLAKLGSGLLFLSGLAFIVVGLAPCDRAGCDPGGASDVMLVHVVSGFTGMTAQSLAPMAFGLMLFRSREAGLYTRMSLLLGAISIAGLVGLVTGTGPPGLAQKTMQFAADIWVFISALHLSRRIAPSG